MAGCRVLGGNCSAGILRSSTYEGLMCRSRFEQTSLAPARPILPRIRPLSVQLPGEVAPLVGLPPLVIQRGATILQQAICSPSSIGCPGSTSTRCSASAVRISSLALRTYKRQVTRDHANLMRAGPIVELRNVLICD